MESETPSDFVWLTSDEAAPFLRRAQEAFLQKVNPVKLAKELRKKISPPQSALVMEQARLRLNARRKFSGANKLFFTGRSLEQSSGQDIAKYKADRFQGLANVADICCGIGGDLLQLAKRSVDAESETLPGTVGVDRDPIAVLFARENVKARALANTEIVNAEFEDFNLSPFDGVHLDPDRRVKERTVVGNAFNPKLSSIFGRINAENQRVAIKVAPASQIKNESGVPFELEWIGDRRECKQQIVWLGKEFCRHQHRTATVVLRDGTVSKISAEADELEPFVAPASEIEEFVYEPHPAVLAANLTDHVCVKYGLQRLAKKVAYLVSSKRLGVEAFPLLAGYRIEKVLTVDLRTVSKELKSLEVGNLIVKNRGIEQVIADRFSRLKLKGPNTATIILTRHGKVRKTLLVTPIDRDE
jgi:hypothetical protein